MSNYESILVDYFHKVDAGESVDQEQLIRDHPEHARQLRRFFNNATELNELIDEVEVVPPLQQRGTHVGRTLGDFEIIREIGRGGMGTVYEAQQISMRRRVAVKVLHAGAALDPNRVRRFEHEAHAVAQLNHAHIVPVYAVGETEGTHFFAMQLIEGRTLSRMLESDGTLTNLPPPSGELDSPAKDGNKASSSHRSQAEERKHLRTSGQLLATVAGAIAHVHERGVVHRDIKPSNLLVDNSGKVWVTDFGLAHLEADDSLTKSGDLIGTVQYMSPEQVHREHPVDARSDVYALGVVLYELITRELPFRGSPPMILQQVVNEDPPAPRKLNAMVSRDLETICLKCLRKAPQQRYGSATALVEDLERHLRGEPVLARPSGKVASVLKWCRRQPGATSAIVSGVLALLIVLGLSVRHNYSISRLNQDLSRAVEDAETRRNALQREVYAKDMRLAYRAHNQGWAEEVDRLLRRQIPTAEETDYRDFSWHLLKPLSAQVPPVELRGHQGPVHDLAVFADGKRVVSVGEDATIRIWDIVDGRLMKVLRDARPTSQFVDSESGPPQLPLGGVVPTSTTNAGYSAVAVSPDQRYLVTGNLVLTLWDVSTGKFVRDLVSFPTRIRSAVFAPNGDAVAVQAADEGVRFVSLRGDPIKSIQTNHGIGRICFTPDGSKLVIPFKQANARGLWLWDADQWQRDSEIHMNVPNPQMTNGIALSNTGNYLFTGAKNRLAYLVDTDSGKIQLHTTQRRAAITDLALSPENKTLAVAREDGTFGVWKLRPDWEERPQDALDGPEFSLPAHQGPAYAIRFIQERRLATCGADGSVKLWETPARAKAAVLPPSDARPMACFVCGGREVFIPTRHGFRRFDATTLELLADVEFLIRAEEEEHYFTAVATTADGTHVALGTNLGEFAMINLKTNEEVHRFEQIDLRISAIEDIAFSPDGRWLAVGSRDHSVRIYDCSDYHQERIWETRGWGTNVDFSPDGQYFAYGDTEGALALIEVATWKPLNEHQTYVGLLPGSLSFTSNDTLVTGHSDSILRIWNGRTLASQGKLKGHTHRVHHVTGHPDGSTLASGGYDGSLRLWHLGTQTEIAVLFQTNESVIAGHFSPDGKQLLISYPVESRGERKVEFRIWSINEATPPESASHATATNSHHPGQPAAPIHRDEEMVGRTLDGR